MEFDFSLLLLALPVVFLLGWLASRMDLRQLHGLLTKQAQPQGIHAPYRQDAALDAAIAKLREQGEIVVELLPGEAACEGPRCDRKLVQVGGQWIIEAIQED